MRLVLREYLAMLRESGELDVLLPDLLLAMSIEPLVRPGSGSRQFGVDLPAVGIDPDEPEVGPKLFLFVIKRGNIGRADWDSGLQSVRQSLNEVLDTYLQHHVRPEHRNLPVKIVVATGGDLREAVAIDFSSYGSANRNRYPQYGAIEFDFWGGDKLSQFMDNHLFDEFMFPESARKQIRKTIAVADQSDGHPTHFYELLEQTFFQRDLPTGPSVADIKARRKAFHLANLSLLVVFRWCEDAGNLRSAYLAAERTLLTAWDWMRRSNLLNCKAARAEFERLQGTYRRILTALAEKIRPASRVQDGLMVADDIENALRIFEVIGLLGAVACSFALVAESEGTEQELHDASESASDIAGILADVIANNPAAYVPRYDQHAIDIGIALIALTLAGPPAAAGEWIDRMSMRVMTAVEVRKHYPVASDSYEDLLAMRGPNPPVREKLLNLSTLLPTVAEWMAILDLRQAYERFRRDVIRVIPDTDLQMWFPNASTDDWLYRANAGFESGSTMNSLSLPERLAELQARMVRVAASQDAWNELSCLREGWTAGALLASRHFRTPLVPALWQDSVVESSPTPPPATD